ncbi:MAG: hypothetical protein CMC76_09105 [Flavobacteriaceae bacterium]|nr:hypothetical protein [Flavobacteriaceae bacterium]|tara:strand:- start:986 stop:1216 length:231 start_codon:yes stop_codon:yes gene_type:complete
MNNKNRKDLRKVIEIINDLKDIVTTIQEEEQEKFDNLPEGLQDSETGMNIEAAATSLEEVLTNLDEAIDNIETAII